MFTWRRMSMCERFERFWQESLDSPRPRWDEYWFDSAWAAHLSSCEDCRLRDRRYRKLLRALEQWNPAIGDVPDLSESSMRLWEVLRRAPTTIAVENEQPPKTVGGVLARLGDVVSALMRRRRG